jgi:hypothetical protein
MPASITPQGLVLTRDITVDVSWADIPAPAVNDWLGLFMNSAPGGIPDAWAYTGGGASGTVTLYLPANATAGFGEFRLYSAGTTTLLATSPGVTLAAFGPGVTTLTTAPALGPAPGPESSEVAWQVLLADSAGNVLAELNDLAEWDYEKRINQVGVAHLRMHPSAPNAMDVWPLGRQVLVRLRYRAAGQAWSYVEDWGGELWTRGLKLPADGRAAATLTFTAYDWKHWLRWAVVAPPPGTEFLSLDASFGDVGIKRAVRAALTDVSPASWRRANLTCAADVQHGAAVAYSARYERLYDVVTTLAGMSGVQFDIVQDAAGAYQFQTYYPRQGRDRTSGNPDGNPPVVCSVDLTTAVAMDYSEDASTLGNTVWVLGAGEGAARAVLILEDAASVAYYGRRHVVLDARSADNEADLVVAGQGALNAQATPEQSVQFTVPRTGGLLYRRDWDLGDRVTIEVADVGVTLEADVVVVKVQRTADAPVPVVTPTVGMPLRTFIDRVAELERGLRVRQAV